VDVEAEWQLFKAAAASSVARVCRRKRIGVANNSKKVIPWWKDGERCYSSKEISLQTLVSEQSRKISDIS